MSDHYIGLDLFGLENNGLRQPISRITLYRGDNAALTAGDDTGLEVVADCIYVKQEMVDALLSAARGYQYHAYSAQAARLNPAAELGDTVEVGSIVSVLAQISDNGDLYPDIAAPGDKEVEDEYPAAGPLTKAFDKKLAEARSEIAKTTDQITLAIYGEDGKGGLNGKMATFTVSLSTISSKVESVETKAAEDLAAAKNDFTVKLKSYSTIEQTDKKIATEVKSVKEYTDGKVGDLDSAVSLKLVSYSTIEQTDEKIATRVAKGSIISEINQSAETVQISASKINLNGYVTFSSLSSAPGAGATKINGGWLEADSIVAGSLSGETVNFLVTVVDEEGEPVVDEDGNTTTEVAASFHVTKADTAEYKIALHSTGALEMLSNNADIYLATGYDAGDNPTMLQLSNDYYWVSVNGNLVPRIDESFDLGEHWYNGIFTWNDLYIANDPTVTSDAKCKNSISYDLSKYDSLFDLLKPVTYKLNSGTSDRKHMGMIAQDVEVALQESGVDSTDFAGFVKFTDKEGVSHYSLRYGEFIGLLIDQVQKLKARVAELEERL